MFAPPPQVVTTTIYSFNIERLLEFYREIGVLFNTEFDKDGQKFYSYIWAYEYYNFEFKFEIYPVESVEDASKNVKLTLLVDGINGYIEGLIKEGGRILKESWLTQHHQHILFADPDKNHIEFITKL